jgi:drug/metabolite transporter (DMT)-like permease
MGVLTVVATLICWSSVPLFLRHFASTIDAWSSNGWRYGFSALVWAPVLIVLAARSRWRPGLWRAALVPSLFNTLGQICFAWAHYKINPGLLTFGLRLQIIFVALGAFVLFPSERAVIRSPRYLLGAALVFSGTIGTILLGDDLFESATAIGVLLAIASGLLFAAYVLSVRKYMHAVKPVVAFAAISQLTALCMVVLMLMLGERSGAAVLDLEWPQIALLLFSSVVGIALGHVLYYISIARLGVATASGVIQLQPFVVGAFSYLLFREMLHVSQWVSGAIAVTGAVLMLSVQKRIGRETARSGRAPASSMPQERELTGEVT